MNEQTGHSLMKVVIEEYYVKEGEEVFRIWRFEGGEWQKQLTPLREFPTVELRRNWEPQETNWKEA